MITGLILLSVAGVVLSQNGMPPPPALIKVNPGGPPIRFQSSGYPDRSRQPVELVVIGAPDGAVVDLYCFDVRVVSQFNPLAPCRDFALILYEGGRMVDAMCDQRVGYRYRSTGNEVVMELRSGPFGMSAFKCEAQAVPLAGASPNLSKSPFFSAESREVDSAEHGGPPGDMDTTCKCGWSNKPKNRIVGGMETVPNEFPFAVALMLMGRQFCGGTIISKKHVVTAAHCTEVVLQNKAISVFQVVAGAHDLRALEATAQVLPVDKILQHTSYDGKQIRNDISLLLVRGEFVFNNVVGPACLSKVQHNLEKQYVKIIGWGTVFHNGPPSSVLKDINIRVAPLKECSLRHPAILYKERRQICTHTINEGACMGDSGGPVVWVDPKTNRYNLVGLVSFGRICASEDPSVHTDVSSYIQWITDNMKASAPGVDFCCAKN